MRVFPDYNLEKIKFGISKPTFERAISLYEQGRVTEFKSFMDGFSALVLGRKPYRVFVSARHYDRGSCECYLGQHDILCKHMVALAIYAIKKGEPLSKEEKEFIDRPICSGRLGELTKGGLAKVKKSIRGAMRYIKPYTGPSKIWFKYQDSLSEGCNRLSAIVAKLPVSKQTAELLVDLLLRLDEKLSRGGVDDSDGTVGGFMEGVVEVLEEYAKLDKSCIKAFKKLCGRDACFGWEEPLVKLLNEPELIYTENKGEGINRSLTFRETHEAFEKAKEQDALVGGELFKNSLDQEVDEMLAMAESKKFEPGIYNFCDRWCEKCEDTEKCFLFAWEQKRKSRRLVEGKALEEDFLGELRHNFELVKKLIERSLNEEGLDLEKVLKEQGKEKCWDEDVKDRYNQTQCLILSKQYMQEAHKFLEDFHQNRFQFYPELGMGIDFSDIKDEIETISWYHTLLPVKVWRLLYERESTEREKDKELKELMTRDLDKYYGLVERCIQRSKIAWRDLGKKRKEFASVSTQFINQLNKIKSELNK